jgi:hypothetical protein
MFASAPHRPGLLIRGFQPIKGKNLLELHLPLLNTAGRIAHCAIEAIQSKMNVQRLLNTPPRRRLPSEILETPPPQPSLPLPLSQLSTQSWDSQNGPRPPCEPSTALISSQNNLSLPQTPQKQHVPPTTRSDRIRIKIALDFNVSPEKIRKKYSYTISQILRARNSRLTPQYKAHCRRKPKVNTPTRQRLEQ